MTDIQLDLSKIFGFVPESSIYLMEEEVTGNFQSLFQDTGKGSDFLGWLTLPTISDETLGQTTSKKRPCFPSLN